MAKDTTELEEKHLENLIAHIDNVRRNCIAIGKHLFKEGEQDMARSVIRNGFKHDSSKFEGIEWDLCLNELKKVNKEQSRDLMRAVEHHTSTNEHHPEFWGGIQNMPEVYVIEMVCDWKGRSTEFGTDLRDWIENTAKEKYGFHICDKVYSMIYKYVEILCEPSFKPIGK
jgi:hypothetical protein